MNGIEKLSPRKTIRIAVVGDHKTGKTTMLNTLTERPNIDINITTSVELFYKTFYINNEQQALQIWDTMGHDVLKHLNKNYLINIDMLIIVFQYGNRKSLNNALLWKELYLSTIKDSSKKII
jgi:small GTP-binding protein